jgi:hypothetical protein
MYKNLYKELMIKAQRESRKKNDVVYYESHHIIPDFMFKNRRRKGPCGHLDGNPDSSSNLVLLTFQEHLLAHYYLFEILKTTRYEHSAGSALQFFFTKATGGHVRQRKLSEVDIKFLNEMSHLRAIGIESISKARRGMMPVVDSKTGESMGSVKVDHPKVLSGEWQHHSKGKPAKVKPSGAAPGKENGNYKELTAERRERLFKCADESIIDINHFSVTAFEKKVKSEFKEFKKISIVWIHNNFGSTLDFVAAYNKERNSNVQFSPYYRGIAQRKKLSEVKRND